VSREPLYPPLEALLEAHERLIEIYGGATGVRDPTGLEAALARAEQLRAYAEEEPSIFPLAAAIGYAIARIRHTFVDGNKRVAFYASVATLWMNGWLLDAAEREAAEIFENVAVGSIEEAELTGWLKRNAVRRD
jgi:death-on-curing protein